MSSMVPIWSQSSSLSFSLEPDEPNAEEYAYRILDSGNPLEGWKAAALKQSGAVYRHLFGHKPPGASVPVHESPSTLGGTLTPALG